MRFARLDLGQIYTVCLLSFFETIGSPPYFSNKKTPLSIMTEAHNMRGPTPLERVSPSRLMPFNAGDASGLLKIRLGSQRGISTSQLPRSLTASGDPL